jgi:hypothetical protein
MDANELERRRVLLRAAVGFAQIRVPDPPPELALVHRWLDSWTGIGHIAVGMARHGYDVSLTSDENGWRATFLHRDHLTRPWIGQVLGWRPTPWEAVQEAAWKAVNAPAVRATKKGRSKATEMKHMARCGWFYPRAGWMSSNISESCSGDIGFTRRASKPASAARRRFSGWP